ncbi:hypothetical protein NKG05_15190 [Oerskovia sp. M15]
MDAQIDLGGGQALGRLINDMGIAVRVSTATKEMRPRGRPVTWAVWTSWTAAARRRRRGHGDRRPTARQPGSRRGPAGRRARRCRRGPRAAPRTRTCGRSARSRASRVGAWVSWPRLRHGRGGRGPSARWVGDLPGADTATKLKLRGVDVASFGDAFARTEGAMELVYADPVAGVYKKLVLSDDARTLLGGVFVGDATPYASLRPMVGRELPGDPGRSCCPRGRRVAARRARAARRRDRLLVQQRHGGHDPLGRDRARVHRRRRGQVVHQGGTSCGSCLPLVKKITTTELEKAGIEVSNALCEHFELSRAQLFDAVRVADLHTFSEIIARFGRVPAAVPKMPDGVARPGSRPRAPAVVVTSASRSSRRSWRRWATVTSCRASRPRSRTPTTTSWRTCRRTAPTRWSRASRAGRSRPRGCS